MEPHNFKSESRLIENGVHSIVSKEQLKKIDNDSEDTNEESFSNLPPEKRRRDSFNTVIQQQPYLNAYIRRIVEDGDDGMFEEVASTNFRSILVFCDTVTGDTLLHIACRSNHINIAKKLITFNSSYSVMGSLIKQNSLGDTPLMVAIANSAIECAIFLLSSGADNLTNAKQRITHRTALHILCESRIGEDMKALIFQMMHLSIEQMEVRTINGETPLALALKNINNLKLIRLFLHYGEWQQQNILNELRDDLGYENMLYRSEIMKYRKEVSSLEIQFIKESNADDLEIVLIRLKAFVSQLDENSTVDDWKKLHFLKAKMDSSCLFGKIGESSLDRYEKNRTRLIDLESQEFLYKMLELAKLKKAGVKIRTTLGNPVITNKKTLQTMLQIKHECIELLETVKSKDLITLPNFFINLHSIIF
ncbi:Ankyrin repeat protein [Entamoeba marina]